MQNKTVSPNQMQDFGETVGSFLKPIFVWEKAEARA